jgi:hypothetical protein
VVVNEVQWLFSDGREIAVDYIYTYDFFMWRAQRTTRSIDYGENAPFTRLYLEKARIDDSTLIVPGAEGETELRFEFPKGWQ